MIDRRMCTMYQRIKRPRVMKPSMRQSFSPPPRSPTRPRAGVNTPSIDARAPHHPRCRARDAAFTAHDARARDRRAFTRARVVTGTHDAEIFNCRYIPSSRRVMIPTREDVGSPEEHPWDVRVGAQEVISIVRVASASRSLAEKRARGSVYENGVERDGGADATRTRKRRANEDVERGGGRDPDRADHSNVV